MLKSFLILYASIHFLTCTNQDEFHAQQTPDDRRMKSAEDSVVVELCPMQLAADAFDLALVLDTCEHLVRQVAVDDAVVDWAELEMHIKLIIMQLKMHLISNLTLCVWIWRSVLRLK